MRESEAIERLRRIATDPSGARPARRCGAVRRAGHHPRQHRRGRPLPAVRSAGERRLEAGRGEPVRPRGQGRDARRGLAVADPLAATASGRAEFIDGVEAACDSYGLPLIGGDTIALPAGAPRVLGLTAIGRAGTAVPDRSGGKPGDGLWLVGNARRCGRRPRAVARGQERGRTAGRCLPPAGAAARRRAGARAACARDDGRVGRPAARRAADGRGERLRRSHRSRLAALVGRVRGTPAATISRRGCSPPPAATIMRCSPRFRPMIRQHFLYLPGRQ